MPYYRKKPIPVEARQFTGDNFKELQSWSHDLVALSDDDEDVICVHTLEGPVWGEKGDYIIQGVRGEFYLCQKDIFEETYEPSDNRDGGQTFQIADIEQNDDVVENGVDPFQLD